MNPQTWLDAVKANQPQLRSLIANYHPIRKRQRAVPAMRITAPAAAQACEEICEEICGEIVKEEETRPDPVERFDKAMNTGHFSEIYALLSSTWFGVPESTECWQIEGFSQCVALLDDPPQTEKEDP